MRTTISSKSDSIQVAYNNYVKGKYIVNQKLSAKASMDSRRKEGFY